MLLRHRTPAPSGPQAAHAALLKKRDELAATLMHIDQTTKAHAHDHDWVDIKALSPDANERTAIEDADLKGATERELKQVEHAIQRQDAGLYGVCEICGSEIDHGRLVAMPEATRCNHCAGGPS